MEGLYIFLGVIAVIIFIIIIWYIATMNHLRRVEVKCDEAESGIDVALNKRFDLITKLVDACKGYMKHENETLRKIIELRRPTVQSNMQEKQEFADSITRTLDSLNVIVENYPDLKAQANFKELMFNISEVEENLQSSRRIYNSNVTVLNQAIVTFPTSIVAKKINLEKRNFFEIEEHKRNDVKIEF